MVVELAVAGSDLRVVMMMMIRQQLSLMWRLSKAWLAFEAAGARKTRRSDKANITRLLLLLLMLIGLLVSTDGGVGAGRRRGRELGSETER